MNLVRGKFPAPPEPEKVASDWQQRGFSCGTFEDPPGRAWRNFTHDSNELITVVEGRLQLTLEGTDMVLEPGDEAFIPRNCLHSVVNIAPTRTVWLYGYDSPGV